MTSLTEEEARAAAVALSKRSALLALRHYELDWTSIRFNGLSDTGTFVVERSEQSAERIAAWLRRLPPNALGYGLIHGDLHQGNLVFREEEARPIDFGRCGYGYFLYDLAGVLLGLYPAERQIVIEGYESVRKLENGWLEALEHFAIMVMIENYGHHAPNPAEWEGLKAEQRYAVAMIDKFLKQVVLNISALPGIARD